MTADEASYVLYAAARNLRAAWRADQSWHSDMREACRLIVNAIEDYDAAVQKTINDGLAKAAAR